MTYRVYMGTRARDWKQALLGNFIGINYGIGYSLKKIPAKDKKEFQTALAGMGEVQKSAIWRIAHQMAKGDLILLPLPGFDVYLTGVVTGDYEYFPGEDYPHRRPILWRNVTGFVHELPDKYIRTLRAPFTIVELPGLDAEILADEPDLIRDILMDKDVSN